MSKKKILIVDDEISVTKLLKFALERSGLYEVSTEHDGTNIFELIKTIKPDLLILDINLPGASGAEISRSLKNDPDLASVPIIFLTGSVTDAEAEAGLTIAGRPALGKPINMERLMETIQKNIL